MTKIALLLLLADLPGWMSGTWRSESPKVISEETWSAADGTLMTGTHRDIRPGKKTWFEFLRIEQRGDSLVYIAMPGGRPATEFAATKIEPAKITFENPQHDFPKRILYWKEGAKLCARVDDGGEKGEEFCWERVGG
jgi:hypothetical protein